MASEPPPAQPASEPPPAQPASTTAVASYEGPPAAWARVAAHLEAALAAIPKPPYEVSNPKELSKRVKLLCKQIKPKLKEYVAEYKALCQRIYSLLKDLVNRISQICKSFYEYVSDKVKRFLKWISGLVQSVRQRYEHLD